MHKKLSFILLFATLLLSSNLFADKRMMNNNQVILKNIPEIPQQIKQTLKQYQNIRSASFQSWDKSGKHIYITTRFGEVNQLHKVKNSGSARQQLTFFDEPIRNINRQPNGDLISYTMDAGGNEFSQIFIYNPLSGEHRMLTNGESRNRSTLWSPSGEKIAYQSTRRNGRSNDIWISDVENPENSKLIHKAEDGFFWAPAAWSEDEKYLLIQNYINANHSKIHLLNLETDELRLLNGSDQTASRNYGLDFGKNNQGYYYLSDENGEFTQLIYQPLDLASKNIIDKSKQQIISTGIHWDIESFILNQDKTKGAFVVNENGLSQLYLFDPTNHNQLLKVNNLPIGRIGKLQFSPNNQKLAMTLNQAKAPNDVFTLALGDSALEYGELTQWTFSEVAGLALENFVEPESFHYPSFDLVEGKKRQIPAFIYKPKNEKTSSPVIILIHGGPESQFRPSFSTTIQLWIKQLGAAVIAPNVRGSTGYGSHYTSLDNGFKREDSVKDIGALLDWIATQPDLDEKRVALYGGSYGGYMVLAGAVHYSNKLRAAIDVVGISNFVTFLKNTKSYRRDLRRVEYGDERNPKMHDFLQKISPNNNVDKITIPFLVVQGNNDPRVPVTEAEQIVKALSNSDKEVWYMNALNEGHGYKKKNNRDLFQQVGVMFFKKHLVNDDS